MPLFGRRKPAEPVVREAEPKPTLPTPPPGDDRGRRGVQDHRDYLLSLVDPLAPFGMHLLDAHGTAICEDIDAPLDVPETDIALLDGYAVLAAGVAPASAQQPVRLPVGDWVVSPRPTELADGQAIRIDAGCPLPAGADAVVGLDLTDRGTDAVQVHAPVAPGEGVLPRGGEVAEGSALMRVGQRLGTRDIGLLSGVGLSKVLARPRPRIVVLSVGGDLAEPGSRHREPGARFDAASFLIAAAATAEGSQVWRVRVEGTEPEVLREAIGDQLIRADLVLITTGPDRADADAVAAVMSTLGLCDFVSVAMEPASYQGMGIIGDDRVPTLLVAGDPVSAYVTFQVFVRPLVRKLRGATPYSHQPVRCFAATVLRPEPGTMVYLLGTYSDEGGRRLVRPLADQRPGVGVLARANCLILLPEDKDAVVAGDPVMVWPLDHD